MAMRVPVCWAINNLVSTSPRTFYSLQNNKLTLLNKSGILVRQNSGAGRTDISLMMGGSRLSTHCRGPHTTPDGAIDMERYERMWNEPEVIPGLNVKQGNTVPELLTHVKTHLKHLPPIIEREFLPIEKENGAAGEDRENGGGDGKENGGEAGSVIRIMQWNTLADALSIGKDNFVRCPNEALLWSSRRLRLLEEILTHDPDILTLQEVDHYGLFKHTLSTCGYVGHFKPKPDSPTLYVDGNNGPDGVAVFIKTGVLDVVEVEGIVLKTLPHLTDTNQVCIIIHLKLRHTGRELVVATTHLKAKSGWEDLRHSQGAYLAAYLEEHVKDKPLIVCGDFNADYNEPVYRVFTDSKLDLTSVYRQATGTGQEPPYTTWKIRGSPTGTERESKRTIDYIWYRHEKLNMISTLALPDHEQIGENRLPSFTYPSDHLSLAADFTIT